MFTGRANAAWFKKVERVRVYIAILLLLLFIDRFTSLRSWLRNFMVVKEPTYKIWAFNSINKATKVADRQWTRLSVWPWVGTLTFPASPETPHQRLQSAICVEKMPGHTIRMTLRFSLSSLHVSLAAAAFQMSVFRPAPVGRSVGKLLWKTLTNTIRLSNRVDYKQNKIHCQLFLCAFLRAMRGWLIHVHESLLANAHV